MTGRRTRYFSSTGFRDQSQGRWEEADDSGCRRSPGIVPPLALPVLNDVLSGVDQLTVCFFSFFFSSSFQRGGGDTVPCARRTRTRRRRKRLRFERPGVRERRILLILACETKGRGVKRDDQRNRANRIVVMMMTGRGRRL